MNWNWDPTQWKRSTKILLGLATIWPVIYMGLFMVTMFSMFLLLPFGEKRSNRSCGNLDVLQLDRKIKDGEIKQLTVRPAEMIAMDRVGNCEFDVAVSNETTRRQILDDASEVVNGHPRVEKIEEEPARTTESPGFIPLGFAGLMLAHLGTIFLIMAAMPFYLILAVKNDRFDQTTRIIWVILLCMMGMFANPVYWYLYVWRKPRTPPAAGGVES